MLADETQPKALLACAECAVLRNQLCDLQPPSRGLPCVSAVVLPQHRRCQPEGFGTRFRLRLPLVRVENDGIQDLENKVSQRLFWLLGQRGSVRA